MQGKLLSVLITLTLLTGCEEVAVMTTPKKTPNIVESHLSTTAENKFWDTLHQGQYQNIDAVAKLMTAAYLQNPHNPSLAAHLGFLHIWKITERERDAADMSDPTIVNEIILAKKYFADAVELAPTDPRFQGFLGAAMLVEGDIFQDERQQVRGYYQLKRAINQWPEFNLFTAGYLMSTRERHSVQFDEALSWQWQTLDLCAGAKVDRKNPDFTPYLSKETQHGPLRACWNSWVAPHNFEGFFLNMGDMLVKQGDWQTALIIYHNAKLSKTYSQWPYKHLLESRIANAKTNVATFQQPHASADKTIMFNSGYGCMVCHQATLKHK